MWWSPIVCPDVTAQLGCLIWLLPLGVLLLGWGHPRNNTSHILLLQYEFLGDWRNQQWDFMYSTERTQNSIEMHWKTPILTLTNLKTSFFFQVLEMLVFLFIFSKGVNWPPEQKACLIWGRDWIKKKKVNQKSNHYFLNILQSVLFLFRFLLNDYKGRLWEGDPTVMMNSAQVNDEERKTSEILWDPSVGCFLLWEV